jgi:PPOX class probable F420-dependent enzyme
LNPADALAFVRQHHRAVLATRRGDGAPQLSPVVATVDGDDRVVVSTRETAVKVRHLRREPRLWLCVLPDSFFGDWIWLEGGVEIVPLPDAMPGLIDYYRSIAGEHEDWDDYRAAMEREHRVLLRVTIDRAGPDVSG